MNSWKISSGWEPGYTYLDTDGHYESIRLVKRFAGNASDDPECVRRIRMVRNTKDMYELLKETIALTDMDEVSDRDWETF